MDILTVGLVVAAAWILVLGVVLAMCRAASRADALSERQFSQRRHSATATHLPAVEAPPRRVAHHA